MKKPAKVACWVILTPIVLFILLVALFYFPPFQNWAVKQVASYASEKTGKEITVEHVHLAFPLDLSVEGIKVINPVDPVTGLRDTIADIKRTVVDVQLLPLFCGNVEIDELKIQDILFNTTDFVESARIKGRAKEISMQSHGIDLSSDKMVLNDALFDKADIDVLLNDSVPEDTTKTENKWVIELQKLRINNSHITVHLPGDTLQISSYLGTAVVNNGSFDLGKETYRIESIDIKDSKIQYDDKSVPAIPGFDYNHLAFDNVNIGVKSFSYAGDDLSTELCKLCFKERSGFTLSSLAGKINMDANSLHIPLMTVLTPYSRAQFSADVDINTFDEENPGVLCINAEASIGKDEIAYFVNGVQNNMFGKWPNQKLEIKAVADGNMQCFNINELSLSLSTVFDVNVDGCINNLTDTEKLFANINLDASTYNVGFLVNEFAPSISQTIRIPDGTKAAGNIKASGSLYQADLVVSQNRGFVKVNGNFDAEAMIYQANLSARAFPIQKFLPNQGLSPFTGKAKVNGRGVDVSSKTTKINATAGIDSFAYGDYDLSGSTMTAEICDGKIDANIVCSNGSIDGNINITAFTDAKNIEAKVDCDLANADFQAMKLVESPLSTSLKAHVDIASDLDEYYMLKGTISNLAIRDSSSVFRPEALHVNMLTDRDTTWAKVNSGDFYLDFEASGGYKRLLAVADDLSKEINRQIERKYISQDSIRQILPNGHLSLHTGNNNFVARYSNRFDYYFREINAYLTSSPVSGLNGTMEIDSLCAFDVQIDKIYLELNTEEDVFKYRGQIENEKDNPQYTFNALFDGRLFETGTDLNFRLYDSADELGVQLGLRAMIENEGIRIKLADVNSVLGYRNFVANDDNYFFISNENRVSAYMKLLADDGTGLHIYSDDENLEALQDITVGINHLDLASLISVVPYCPNIGGVLNGDFHIIQTPDELSVSTSLSVDRLTYDNYSMGNMSTEFVYIPREDGGHYVDGIIMHDDNEVGIIKGTYTPDDKHSYLDAKMSLTQLPLNLVNGFIPDQIVGLRGTGDGELSIVGPLSNLKVNGEIDLHDAYFLSDPYGVEMRFDDRPVQIVDGRLTLEDFNMYSHNSQPLVMNGYIDFSNLDRMSINMNMRARNFLLIDSKQNRKSETFGKAYVNFDATMTGLLEAIQMKGRLDVLGTTDMTYILRDSPLTTDYRMDDLVQFVDFSDETSEIVARPAIEGLYMDIQIAIDQGAHILCALNETKTNYLDLTGGGNLRMFYKDEEISLTGRYTLRSGEMKYSLPIIPLKTFEIQNGSYVEFTGEPLNPTLNITAIEKTKATVSNNGSNRSVDFNCGVVMTKTLEDMGLEFTIDAPEDMTLHSELQTMSAEERGKIAVTMLTTGMYLTDNNLSSMNMNSALSSYLQSEINSITGNALRTLDLSIGLDNSTDATGALHTDYSFKFAKRLWNNKVNVVVGGKVSTDDAQNQSLFDNVALEYRLDPSANTNVKLFYDRAVYDYLEGYVGEYGVGLVWKRKIQSLRDLFPRKSGRPRKKQEPQASEPKGVEKGEEQ